MPSFLVMYMISIKSSSYALFVDAHDLDYAYHFFSIYTASILIYIFFCVFTLIFTGVNRFYNSLRIDFEHLTKHSTIVRTARQSPIVPFVAPYLGYPIYLWTFLALVFWFLCVIFVIVVLFEFFNKFLDDYINYIFFIAVIPVILFYIYNDQITNFMRKFFEVEQINQEHPFIRQWFFFFFYLLLLFIFSFMIWKAPNLLVDSNATTFINEASDYIFFSTLILAGSIEFINTAYRFLYQKLWSRQ